MQVLVFNCGSSSIKTAVIDSSSGRRLVDLRLEGIAESVSRLRRDDVARDVEPCAAFSDALEIILEELAEYLPHVSAVGHRVVHGGAAFVQPTLIDDAVCSVIESLIPLAPLHNDACLGGIRAAMQLLPALPHVAAFDTAFHSSLPEHAYSYALPAELMADKGLRRYGFHGLSHEYVAHEAASFLGSDIRDLKIITCHLGNGASLAAIEHGRSIDTSMGMTPLEGLVMGTRSGDLDPGIVLHLLQEGALAISDLSHLLNRKSGLLGLGGFSSMQDIEREAEQGNDSARLALAVYCYRIVKYIGAYAAVLGGVDAVVFTGGVGENSALVRQRVAGELAFLGARLDVNRNLDATVGAEQRVCDISRHDARLRLLVIATDEEFTIAKSTAEVVAGGTESIRAPVVPVAISARHVHLTRPTIECLFGPDYELTPFKTLSQPGQYAAAETVTLVGPQGTLEHVRVLGPPRSEDQVEISRTDELRLGLDAPVRASGDVERSPGIVIQGPAGRLELDRGVICAWRHIHMTPDDALRLRVTDGDTVDVQMGAEHRHVLFRDVLVRVSPDYRLEMHIDTDEANAADLPEGAHGVLVRSSDPR